MFDHDFLSVLLLSAGEEPGFLIGLLSQVWLWVKVAIGIGLVIFVHELGHFLAAKFFGVKCEKFYVGFDVPIQLGPIKLPRTLGKFQYGETEYGIGILPLGGYVKMLGQDDDPRNAEKEAERIKVDEGDRDAPPQYDPRSFPAKPVWQRMIIISAGVVVNVITGMLFAAIAYGFGVPYTPAVVGGVTPGGSAWQAGIRPGGEVVAVAELESEDQLHFTEMKLEIMEQSLDNPALPVDVRIRYDGTVNEYKLLPQPHPEEPDLRMIGITNAMAAKLQPMMPAFPGTVAAEALGDEWAGATIVSVDGKKIDVTGVAPAIPLQTTFVTAADRDIQLTLQPIGPDAKVQSVTIPPQPMRTLGLAFAPGPITAVMSGSPAEEAGIRVGDVITAVDGNPEVDAYRLVLRSSLASSGETPIAMTLRRGEAEDSESIEVSLKPNTEMAGMIPISPMSNEIASGPLGIAFAPLPIVSRGPAAGDHKIAAGDEIKSVRVLWDADQAPDAVAEELSDAALEKLTDGWEFDATSSLNSFVSLVQLLPEGTRFEVLARRDRDNRVLEENLTTVADEVFWYERGLALQATSETQTADSVGQALVLGIREGGRRLNDVFGFLGLLVQGKVKAKFVGGPIRIVQMAGMQAEQGISKQLLFLTMLSMNLAILNFLPIPALDGGHMMFLTAELIRGKRVDEQLEMKLTLAGVLAILALMVFVFANDIIHS